jgi:hypothetical protein
MNLKNIAILGAVGFIVYKIANKKTKDSSGYIQKGDKNTTIKKLQENINKIAGQQILNESGEYDKKTLTAVQNMFKDTNVLLNEETGKLDCDYVKKFNKQMENTFNK